MNLYERSLPSTYPYERQWDISSVDVDRYVSLKNNWDKSKEVIGTIRNCLSTSTIHSAIQTIAAAGSLGRMEACPGISDADLIIVLSDEIDLDTPEGQQEAEEAWDSVWEVVMRLVNNIEQPKKTGVFAKATNRKKLLKSVGDAAEQYEVFGKRLLLLLETQPVFNDENYTQLIDSIVDSYAAKYVERDPKKEWTFLLNDLIRYFRSLAVNYQWDFDNEAGKWPLRNVKLRHSRLIMYGGLLTLLGEASKERKDKVTWLKKCLKMTPLERLAWVYEQNKDWNFHRVAGLYDVFLLHLNNPETRKKLNVDPVEAKTEDEDSYKQRYKNPEFATLKANSDGLIAELLRFVIARRGVWSERFFEYLIF